MNDERGGAVHSPSPIERMDNMAATTEAKSVAENMADVKAPTEIMVEAFLPKIPGEPPFQYVAVNGKAWQIPRGKKYQIPEHVAQVLERAQKAQEAADEYSDEEQKKMTVIQGAPV